MTETLIKVRDLSRVYDLGENKVKALQDVSFDIQRGKFVALKGKSGSGKTTLLNLLGGLDHPTSGEIVFDGSFLGDLDETELTSLRREKMGFVFQSFALIPTFSALENVEIPLRLTQRKADEVNDRSRKALQVVGLLGRADSRPDELSGGQQQRIAIARALVSDPLVILADEPTGELDTENTKLMLQLFRNIVHKKGITIIMTSHNPLAEEYADSVLSLVDGKIVL